MKQKPQILEDVPTADLIPYARNARKHPPEQVAQIAGSIKEFGFNAPVLIDAENGIIAGHGRVLAAHKLGLASVPCRRLTHLTEAQKRAYILADNRMTETGGGWDMDMLKIELGELDELEIDLEGIGFGADFEFGEDEQPEQSDVDAEPQVDKADELREKWGVETGQLWQLGEHRILCGDSTIAEDVERALDGAKPLLLVTDPPYGVEYDAEWRKAAMPETNPGRSGGMHGKVNNDNRADWREAWALFTGDVAYVWHAGNKAHIVAESILCNGFELVAQIIWAKNNHVISRGNYHPKHEPCWYAVRKGGRRNFTEDRTQNTLWEIPSNKENETGHSTQKPVECMARPIRNHDSEFVYEPFSGSGTTIIACEQLGRKCRAIEISPAYVAVAIQRWADATGKEPKRLS